MKISQQDVTGTPLALGMDLLEAHCDSAEGPG